MSKTKSKQTKGHHTIGGGLAIYDGSVMAGWLLPTDDGRFEAYNAKGCSVGAFDTIKEATRSLPKAEVVS